jgi:hypothetical protein
MNITMVFSAPKLLALDATPEAVVATFQWPGSGNISTVTVKRGDVGEFGPEFIRTETGQGADPEERHLVSAYVLHWEYETSGIPEYVAAIAAL